jgi:ferredoxin
MKVVADRSVCCGSGQCTLAAPTLFDQDEDTALVVVLDVNPPEADRPLVIAAIERCPTGAISVRDN